MLEPTLAPLGLESAQLPEPELVSAKYWQLLVPAPQPLGLVSERVRKLESELVSLQVPEVERELGQVREPELAESLGSPRWLLLAPLSRAPPEGRPSVISQAVSWAWESSCSPPFSQGLQIAFVSWAAVLV